MKKKSSKKYTPLNIRLEYGDSSDLDGLKENLEFKKLIYSETAAALTYLSQNKRSKIDLFNLTNIGITVSVEKNDYQQILDSTLKFYGDLEDYDKCIELSKLKDKL